MLPYLGNNVLKDLISSGAKPIASGASTLLEMAGTRCASCPRHYRYVHNMLELFSTFCYSLWNCKKNSKKFLKLIKMAWSLSKKFLERKDFLVKTSAVVVVNKQYSIFPQNKLFWQQRNETQLSPTSIRYDPW